MVLWSLGLLMLALFFLALELFIPSAGVLSVLATCSLIAAIVVGFMGSMRLGLGIMLVSFFVIPIVIAVGAYYWPHTPIGRLIVIGRPQDDSEVLPDSEGLRKKRDLVGRVGTVKTKMLPSGAVLIDGETYDAISSGMPLDPGQTVEVVEMKGNRLLVKPSRRLLADQSPLEQPIEALGLESFDEQGPEAS